MWLDEYSTSPFDLYGYFVRRSDDEVEGLLRLLTFVPMERIQKTMDEHRNDPPKRVAQHLLASEVLTLVHGHAVAAEARKDHSVMYPRAQSTALQPTDIETPLGPVTLQNRPRIDMKLPRSLVFNDHRKISIAEYSLCSRTRIEHIRGP